MASLIRWKKDLHTLDNHNGVITDLEPDILECEVKWALAKRRGIIWTSQVFQWRGQGHWIPRQTTRFQLRKVGWGNEHGLQFEAQVKICTSQHMPTWSRQTPENTMENWTSYFMPIEQKLRHETDVVPLKRGFRYHHNTWELNTFYA